MSTPGFRVAIPGKDANTAVPKEVITDTTLISLPIHWEGPVLIQAPGGVKSGLFDTTPIIGIGTVYHDLDYEPLTRAWSTITAYDGTDVIESPTAKARVPNGHGATFNMIMQTYAYKDRVEIKCYPPTVGIDGHNWLPYTLHAYLYIFEFQPEEFK